MATKRIIADDIYKKYGAVLAISEIMKYCNMGRNWSERLVANLQPLGQGKGKRYFYEDVAEQIIKGG